MIGWLFRRHYDGNLGDSVYDQIYHSYRFLLAMKVEDRCYVQRGMAVHREKRLTLYMLFFRDYFRGVTRKVELLSRDYPL
jgi:hypothetical protein